jgi:hypothetical protein
VVGNAEVFAVPNHAGNLHPRPYIAGELKLASDRIAAGPVAFRHGLVDDCDTRSVWPVGVVKDAATHNRNAKRVEEIGGDLTEEDCGIGLAGWRSVAVHTHRCEERTRAHGPAAT